MTEPSGASRHPGRPVERPFRAADGRCPHCGTDLATATVDLDRTPDVTEEVDEQRATLQPGEMASVLYCPNPQCPGRGAGNGPDTGARV